MNDILAVAKKNMVEKEKMLSCYACKSEMGKLLDGENSEDIRPIFFRDIDRIIHSLAYTRYIDKTQVYSFVKNDHITHRVLHVQLVSKIARTIGRSLMLNEDLIEAISLGHDVGHTPFGHKGERFLDEICKKEHIGLFQHNGQSVRLLKDLEGLNISMQTLDGILAHNGEMLLGEYGFEPNKTKEQFLDEIKCVFTVEDYSKNIVPMTLEACVVRISDVIAYVGRDIEDSIIVGDIKREDLPKSITKVLGNNNSSIVDTLIKDLIIHSMDKPFLTFSEEVFRALMELKDWNYKYIYASETAGKNEELVRRLFNELFYIYHEKVKDNYIKEELLTTESERLLYKFVGSRASEDEKDTIKRTIIDYISGQTDSYFLAQCEEFIPEFDSEKLYNK